MEGGKTRKLGCQKLFVRAEKKNKNKKPVKHLEGTEAKGWSKREGAMVRAAVLQYLPFLGTKRLQLANRDKDLHCTLTSRQSHPPPSLILATHNSFIFLSTADHLLYI